MKKPIILAIVAVLLVLGGLAGTKVFQITKLISAGKAYVPPPETIAAAETREEVWHDSIPGVASITAAQGVTLTPEVPGTVSEIAFESGVVVKQGDLLVKLDTSSEEAQLRAIEAQVALWRLNFARAQQLWTNNAVSKSEFDAAEATLKQGEANADVIRVTIQKKTLRAPFAGRTGIRQVNLGEYVDKGKPVISLQSLASVFAETMLPQQTLASLATGLQVRLTTDAFPEKVFTGTLTAINSDFDAVSRSVRVQATLPNTEQLLRPGMFARIEILLPDEQKVLAVPATSILSAPYGDSVYVIEPSTNAAGGLVVRQQLVRVGRSRGDFVSVTSGLKAGQRIVSSGIFKLRNGMSVVENSDETPKSAEKPKPSDS